MTSEEFISFMSFTSMRDTHRALLKKRRKSREAAEQAEFWAEVTEFLHRGDASPVVYDTAVFGFTALQSSSFNRAFVRVDSLPNGASPFGIFGMAGGAAEWVQDWYDPDFYSQPLPAICRTSVHREYL